MPGLNSRLVAAVSLGATLGVLQVPAARGSGSPERIWIGPDVNLWGAPSPDGRLISYVEPSSGNLAIREIRTRAVRKLTRKAAAEEGQFAYFSVFSRQGDRIAYAWFNGEGRYELRIAGVHRGADGIGEPRLLYSNPEVRFVQPCAWSADGTRILALFFRQDSTSQIAMLGTRDGSVRVLRSLSWVYPKKMDLSPDGRFLVYDNFSESGSDERDLYVMSADGSASRRLLAGPSDDQHPVWSHDGSAIAFLSDRGGSRGIWSVPVSDGEATGSPSPLARVESRSLLMGMSSDGSLFFGQRVGAARLYAQPWDPVALAPSSDATEMTSGQSEGDRVLPVFAPDGEQLAYLAQVGSENLGQGHQALVLQSLSSGASHALDTRMTEITALQFSKDSNLLWLAGRDRRARLGIFLHDRDRGRTRLLEPAATQSDGAPAGALSSSAASAYLAVTDGETGESRLVERMLDGDGPDRRLLSIAPGGRFLALALSPDGTRIALAWLEGAALSETRVAVADLPQADNLKELLKLSSGELTDLVWEPGGKHLLVGTRGSAGAALWLVPETGESMRQVPSRSDRLPGLSFHPDGRTLAYAAGQTREEIWVLKDAVPARR